MSRSISRSWKGRVSSNGPAAASPTPNPKIRGPFSCTVPRTIKASPKRVRVVPAGSLIAEADAPEVIHRVGPVEGRAVSIHVYAGPMDSFLAFDEIRGTAKRAALSTNSK